MYLVTGTIALNKVWLDPKLSHLCCALSYFMLISLHFILW